MRSKFAGQLAQLVGNIRDLPDYLKHQHTDLYRDKPKDGWQVLWKHFGYKGETAMRLPVLEEIVVAADQVLGE